MPEILSDITRYLLHTLGSGGDLRVRWRYGVPSAQIDGFALLPAEYFAFANELGRWDTVTGPVDGQSLTYTVQRWSLVDEHENADTDDYTEIQFVLTDEGRAWLADHARSNPSNDTPQQT